MNPRQGRPLPLPVPTLLKGPSQLSQDLLMQPREKHTSTADTVSTAAGMELEETVQM